MRSSILQIISKIVYKQKRFLTERNMFLSFFTRFLKDACASSGPAARACVVLCLMRMRTTVSNAHVLISYTSNVEKIVEGRISKK